MAADTRAEKKLGGRQEEKKRERVEEETENGK